jgi:hypothetical protein
MTKCIKKNCLINSNFLEICMTIKKLLIVLNIFSIYFHILIQIDIITKCARVSFIHILYTVWMGRSGIRFNNSRLN